jgi:outer membrane protein assembly factor BamB
MSCFDLESGDLIWQKNVDSIYQTSWHMWGVAESPLIVDSMVITVPVGEQTAMVALNKYTGAEIWKTKSIGGERSYTSPVVLNYNGIRQIIAVSTRDVFGVDPATGEIEWIYEHSKRIAEIKNEDPGDNINPNSPLVHENEIYITDGYDLMSVMLVVGEDGKSVSEKWIDRTLDNHHHGVVLIDGYIYGSNWLSNRHGRWVCMDWETSEVRYVHEWETKGSIVSAEGMFYLYDERNGNVALCIPDKDEFRLVSSFKVDYGEGQYWAHPFICKGMLFIRHGGSIGVYDIKAD